MDSKFQTSRLYYRLSTKHMTLVLLAIGLCPALPGQPSSRTPEDEFAEVKLMATPLPIHPPASGAWKTPQENKEDQQRQAAAFAAAAAKAKDFYTTHPTHTNAPEAKKIECVALMRAVQAGLVEQEPQAARLAAAYRADKGNPSSNRYEVAMLVTELDVKKKNLKDRSVVMDEHEQQALNLLGEFPDEPAVYEYFLGIARNSDPAKARAMAQRVLLMPASTTHKEQARAVIDRLNLPGTAPSFEWQDEEGVSRRIADYKGKIVVFYVWATWSAGAASADSAVAAAIAPGIELVSVNVDTDVKNGKDAKGKKSLPGTAYFDDRGLQSPLALQLKADKVPGVHVVDAKGVYVGRGAPTELAKLLQQAAK